ncbi:MAG: hypothetical protein R6W66_03055 [Pelovirga sp.]
MSKGSALLAVCFVAGLLGALISRLCLWAGAEWGLTRILNVKLFFPLNLSALYPALFAGGLWGLLYFFTIASPRTRRHWVRKGLWCSLVPAMVAIFYLYPQVHHRGIGGMDLGLFTPGFILVEYLIWGLFTGFFARLLWGR